ncbi:MAG TPA: radical SAM protein [Nitrospirota bacterium]|nr:radical SAM protein [Nitrospirota bacterium]
MNIRTILLMRVSSSVDKDVEHPQFFDPPYALKCLQAGLEEKRDLQVHLLDCWIRPMSISRLLDYSSSIMPDLVVVSASSFDIDVADQYVNALKTQQHPPLIVGIGQGFYHHRDLAREQTERYDAILLGEPEQEFFRLFDHIRANGTTVADWKTHYRKSFDDGKRFLVEEPDRLVFPSYTADELAAYQSIFPVQVPRRVVWGYLVATRGCPHNCMFCSEVMRVSTGRKLRSRSAASVADEMEHLAKQGVNICSFQDDSFSANRKFMQSLCEELVSRTSKMPWMARVRVDELNYELLALMKKAGCVMLGIGVESGSERIIKAMHKQGANRSWIDLCRQVFGWTRSLGIGTNAYYVIGNPTETREEIEQTIQLALELNSDSIQVHFYTPYPGSQAWDLYKDQVTDSVSKQLYHYARPIVSLAAVSPQELVKLRSSFYKRYLFRPRFALRHLWRYGLFYLHNPDILWSLLGIRKIF